MLVNPGCVVEGGSAQAEDVTVACPATGDRVGQRRVDVTVSDGLEQVFSANRGDVGVAPEHVDAGILRGSVGPALEPPNHLTGWAKK